MGSVWLSSEPQQGELQEKEGPREPERLERSAGLAQGREEGGREEERQVCCGLPTARLTQDGWTQDQCHTGSRTPRLGRPLG